MDAKKRCQSCGMLLSDGLYGTEFDEVATSEDYCKLCYQNGVFTKDITMEEMIKMSIDHMTEEFRIPLNEASTLARSIIPNLKRWQLEN